MKTPKVYTTFARTPRGTFIQRMALDPRLDSRPSVRGGKRFPFRVVHTQACYRGVWLESCLSVDAPHPIRGLTSFDEADALAWLLEGEAHRG